LAKEKLELVLLVFGVVVERMRDDDQLPLSVAKVDCQKLPMFTDGLNRQQLIDGQMAEDGQKAVGVQIGEFHCGKR